MTAILLISSDREERDALVATLRLAELRSVVTDSIFDGMSVLGRADFRAVVFPVTRRVLQAKGLCQIARREHPGITLMAVRTPEVTLERVKAAFPDPDVVILDSEDPRSLVQQVIECLADRPAASAPSELNFDETDPLDPDHAAAILGDYESDEATLTGPAAESIDAEELLDDTQPHSIDRAPTLPLLTGDLNATRGVEVLVTIALRGLTGVLDIVGDCALTFVNGDAVWASHRDGAAGWLRDLRRDGVLPPGTRAKAFDELALLEDLQGRGLLDAQDVEELARQLVHVSMTRVVEAFSGAFTFREGEPPPRCLEEPMTLFEVLLNRLRRSFDAREIKRRAKRIEGKPLFATAALAPMSARLAPFLDGRDVARSVDGKSPCRELWADLGLSREAGALLIYALIEANLATFDGDPVETTGPVQLRPLPGGDDSDTAPKSA